MAANREVTRGDVELVGVKSTLPVVPYPPPEQRVAILTERLLLRPYQESDLQALHEMRSDPDVAQWTSTGIADIDIEETKKSLEPMLQNALERQDYVICQASTGQVIGQGGCHRRCGTLGWPEIGYSFKKEFWGQGYGTEFLQGFLQWWWTLPRAELDLKVDVTTIPDDQTGGVVPECMVAITIEANHASRGVMAKSGFKLVRLHPHNPQLQTTMSTISANFPLPTNHYTDAGEGTPGVDAGTEAGAAGDSSRNSINLSTGGMIAIIIVVVVVVIVGVSTATLFFIAKKREWKVRETLRRSARKVAAALTPRRSQFPDSVKRSVQAPKSSRLQTVSSRDGMLRLSSEDVEKGYPPKDKGKRSRK